MAGRAALKAEVARLLASPDLEGAAVALRARPARQTLSALMGQLSSPSTLECLRAAGVLGRLVGYLSRDDLELGREVVRRLLWGLNQESGSIIWAAPQALAEIMAHNQVLAREFHCIYISYITPGPNYLEHLPLQRGVLWGLGLLAQVHPDLLSAGLSPQCITPFLNSPDPELRGLAARLLALLGHDQALERLKRLSRDSTPLLFYAQGRMESTSVGQLARQAVTDLEGPDSLAQP